MIHVYVRRQNDRPALQLQWSDPLTGAKRRRSAKTSDRKEAERAAIRLEEQLNAGHVVDNISWDAFRLRYEDEHLTTLHRGPPSPVPRQ